MGVAKRAKPFKDQIDSLDEKILNLLNKRARLVLKAEKGRIQNPMWKEDPGGEREIVEHLVLKNRGPLSAESVSHIFQEIIYACQSLQGNFCVAYLGPMGSYTHQACVKYFGKSLRTISKESIEEVFRAVESGEISYGVVPVENSNEGTVYRTLDMFVQHEVKICGEVLDRISHALLSRLEDQARIRRIYSHPQAFGQCEIWLRKNLPDVERIETSSTAKGALMAKSDPNGAAIASPIAAPLFGLKILRSRIEDNLHNSTRFFVIGLKTLPPTGKDKTSILFSIPHIPGALYRVLKIFAEKGVNLTKIESRPLKERPWEYIFFIDMEGHAEDPPVNQALLEVKGEVNFMKVLGSYPNGIMRKVKG